MPKSMMRMFTIVTRFKGRLVASQLLLLVSALATVAFATLTQALIDDGVRAGDQEAILTIGFWMVVLAVIAGLTMLGAAGQSVFFATGTSYTIRSLLYSRLQTFSFANYDRFPTGELMVRLNADAVNVQNGMLYALMLGLYAPFMILAAGVLTVIKTPELVWLLIVTVVVVVVAVIVFIPAIFRNFEERQARLDAVNNKVQENVTGIQVVKAFVREDTEVERFDERAEAMRKPAYGSAWRVAFLNPLLVGIGQIAIITSVMFGGFMVLENSGLEVGEVFAFTQYLALTIAPLALFAIVVPMVLRADTSAQRILEVYDGVAAIQDRPEAKVLDPSAVEGRVVFDNVTFAFRGPDGDLDPPVLKNINLTIEPGEQIGILGATGSGKSALVNLIPRFYDVTEGKITIDGIDVRDIPHDNLLELVGIALQESVLFKGDIRFNMKFTNPEADDDVMIDAAKAADSYGFVSNLPEAWDAPVSRRGYNFSGGQRQRLSINRTLVQRPRVLILDDSTSALDASTEGRVQSAIPGFTHDCTTIYVAQRISAVIELDKVILLEDGEIVALGSHAELLESNPLYQEIYESQLGGAITTGLDLEEVAK